MKYNIGFMQGRLSPMQGKKIQSFPWKNWKNEFQIGRRLNFKIIEWTLDFNKLYSNPLMTDDGQKKLRIFVQNIVLKFYLLQVTVLCKDLFGRLIQQKEFNYKETF